MKLLGTLLLVCAAIGAGAWKILDLAAANHALARQNDTLISAATEVRKTLEAVRSGTLRLGSPVAPFTLLGADGAPVGFDPVSEQRPVHLLFLDPAQERFSELLQSYREAFGRASPPAQTLVLASSGYEATRTSLARSPSPYPVAVHAGELYLRYGVVDGPAMVLIEDGRLRARWRLPYRRDQLPVE